MFFCQCSVFDQDSLHSYSTDQYSTLNRLRSGEDLLLMLVFDSLNPLNHDLRLSFSESSRSWPRFDPLSLVACQGLTP